MEILKYWSITPCLAGGYQSVAVLKAPPVMLQKTSIRDESSEFISTRGLTWKSPSPGLSLLRN